MSYLRCNTVVIAFVVVYAVGGGVKSVSVSHWEH